VKIALAAAAALLLAWTGAPRAQPAPPSCQSFTRSSGAAPEIVRSWLERSGDDHVLVCTAPAAASGTPGATLYTAESAVARSRGVCSYSSHLLTRVGTGVASRLQRVESAAGIGMTIAGSGACPTPHSAPAELYTMTYDLTPAVFESIMAFWAATAASAAAFDHELACCTVRGSAAATPASAAASATRERLRAAIAAGRMQAAAVTRIVRLAGRGVRHRYALFVANPDSHPPGASVYVIYLSKWLAGPWRLSDITDVAP
jgi:hypothetical protein